MLNIEEGKVQEEELDSCRAADGRRSAKRDEGSGETEGVSPGAIFALRRETKRPRTNPGPKEAG